MNLRYSASASRELLDAVAFYEKQEVDLGAAFQMEVQRVESMLLKHPLLARRVKGKRRAALLYRFPYRLIYTLDDVGIRILAVAHQKRRPDYWWGRVEEQQPCYTLVPTTDFSHKVPGLLSPSPEAVSRLISATA